VKASEIIAQIKLRAAAQVKRPLHIVGSPGLGKTQIVAQAARDLGIDFRALHAPLMQPEDYGFPVVSADKADVNFIVSKGKFPIEGSACADKGILLIDELPQADTSGQKILANLIQEREIHGQRLKAGWLIVSTGNKATDRAGASRLLSHLNDRLTVINFDASIQDWSAWAMAHNVPTELVSFLNFRPDLLNNFDANADKNATPRSWVEGIGVMIGQVSAEAEYEIFKGDVGEGPAAEFCKFLRIFRTLPDVNLILLDPDKQAVPTDVATLFALCGALAHKTSADNFSRVMSYVKRMPPEFTVLYVKQVMSRDKKLAESKAFITWASTDGAKILI